MAKYIYTFIRNGQSQEVEAVNLLDGCKKLDLMVTRFDRLPTHYLATTKFNDRERIIWCNNLAYTVKQRYKTN